jgi:hypothetical protein
MSWQHRHDLHGWLFRRAAYVVAKNLLTGLRELTVIHPDVAKMLESGVSLVVGTVDGGGLPDAPRAWGAWVLHGPERVRFLLPDLAARTIANLAGGGLVAVTASHVVTHRSVQLKGAAAIVEPATRDDLDLGSRYKQEFFDVVSETDAIDRPLMERMAPTGFVAVEFTVSDVFDQTPGPTAGKCIT